MKFSVGEIAIIVLNVGEAAAGFEKYVGSEVEVLSKPHPDSGSSTGVCYRVMASDGIEMKVAHTNLRKKKPPKDEDRYDGNDVIPWDQCDPILKPFRREKEKQNV